MLTACLAWLEQTALVQLSQSEAQELEVALLGPPVPREGGGAGGTGAGSQGHLIIWQVW